MIRPETYQAIEIDKRASGVTVATLNRPHRLNAVDATMHSELARIAREAHLDSEVRVLVLTSAGRAFSAGGDVSPDGGLDTSPGSVLWKEVRLIVDDFLGCEKPIISAVRGHALGLGATVALLADVVYAGRSAVFADTHVKMGLGAGDGGQFLWPLLIGPNRAKYYLMTGDPVTADDAQRLGLVNFVVDDDDLLDATLALAERLARGSQQAIAASKVGVNAQLRAIANLVMPVAVAAESATMQGADYAEAARAFAEKRDPRFS
ncbi:enoyl-CoA hydratase-related protein [Modestobacter excelsi]|uniref:enoyl-CoA hydratase-related protein n=1 Tax=Modestobacter excelsi TaxID=2213161 RepID=UPI001C20E448|nr:enoyl-CoA hydratase-related protein [Modestobacter excelsi]